MTPFTSGSDTLHYSISGKGRTVIFLHGFLENHKIWLKIAPVIEALGCQVVLIDLPCHGLSRFEGEICTMKQMAELIHVFCTSQSIENPSIFGHSMGGYIGMELLNIRSINLCLIHSNFWEDSAQKKKDRDRVVSIVKENKMRLINEAIPHLFAEQNRIELRTVIADLIKDAAEIPVNEIIASTRGMRDRTDNTALLHHHTITLIQGDSDPVIPINQMHKALENIRKKQFLYTIKNCGHMSIWESPDTLINSLKLTVFK